tara:strand:+ start:827 stop:2185 length:1359 start_codon:yes stop_codon:yes gene_type:complete
MNLKVKLFFIIFFFPTFLVANNFLGNQLTNVLVSTYNSSPKLKLARERLFEKDEMLPQAYAGYRPELSGFYSKGKIDTATSGSNIISDGVRTETQAGIKLTQKIYNGGSTQNNIKAAKNEIIAQRYNLKNTEQEVLLEAIHIYSKLASKLKEILLNEKNVEFLNRQFELAQDQFDIGEITLTDVSIAKSRLFLAESEFIKSKSDLQALNSKFLALTGIKPDNPELFFDFPKFDYSIEELEKKCIQNNPVIINQNYLIKSAEKRIKSLFGNKLPSIKLEAEARKSKGYFRSDSAREVMSATASINIPIYSSGLASSKMREAKKNLESLKELKKIKLNELKYNLTFSWSSYNSSISKIKAYKEQIEANNKFLEGLKQELFLGERTLLDILDAEQELIESEFNLVKSFEEYFNAYFDLLFYMGQLNSKYLDLPVEHFDDTKNYNEVKFKWLDIIE